MRIIQQGDRMRKKIDTVESLPMVQPHAAGLDIGAREIWACVPPDQAPEPVRRFATFTPDLQSLTNWLVEHKIETVAVSTHRRLGKVKVC